MVIMALSEFLVGQRNTNESVLYDIETRVPKLQEG